MTIPPFRSMKYLHGVLLFLAIAALCSWFIPHYLIKPEYPETIALFQWANFMALGIFAPIFGLVYRSISSNQY